MRAVESIRVHVIDGTDVWVPVAAERLADGTWLIHANEDFDPADGSELWEFIPGDQVEVTLKQFDSNGGQTLHRVAAKLIATSHADADYWHILFIAALGQEPRPQFGAARLRLIAKRVIKEIDDEGRWHYPGVIEWARRTAKDHGAD